MRGVSKAGRRRGGLGLADQPRSAAFHTGLAAGMGRGEPSLTGAWKPSTRVSPALRPPAEEKLRPTYASIGRPASAGAAFLRSGETRPFRRADQEPLLPPCGEPAGAHDLTCLTAG